MLSFDDLADVITDFRTGHDILGLTGDVTFDDRTFDGSDIIFQGVQIATLTGVDTTVLTELDIFMF